MAANVVTRKGLEMIVRLLQSLGSQPLNVSWGTNPSSVSNATGTDVGMFKESSESRTAGTASTVTTTTTNDTFQVVGTITSTGSQTIAEVGLFDSTTKPFSGSWTTAPTTTSGTAGTA